MEDSASGKPLEIPGSILYLIDLTESRWTRRGSLCINSFWCFPATRASLTVSVMGWRSFR